MQLQFSNSNNSSSTGSHYYSGTYARRTLQAHQVQPLSSSSSSSAYQLLQHPMIVQSRSTDSQLDVDSYNFYSNGESMKRKDHDNTLSHKSNVTVPSFFNRTHPVLLNESSESSSSSSSSVTMIQQSKENIDCRISVAPSTKTTEKENKLTVANLRRRRSQNISTPTPRVTTTSDTNGDESDNDTDDDDDDDDDHNFAKRSKWDVEMYNTHDNGLWIQRSYAFDDDSDDDDRLDENVEVTVNIPIDFHQSWMTEPLVR